MNYTANDVLDEIARSFYGTDHEDWLRYDAGELRLGNRKVWVDGDTLTWRDLGSPRIAGTVEIPAGFEMGDIVIDEVGQWLLGWTDDIDADELLETLQDEIGGELTEDMYGGDQMLVENAGETAWAVRVYAGEETTPLLLPSTQNSS